MNIHEPPLSSRYMKTALRTVFFFFLCILSSFHGIEQLSQRPAEKLSCVLRLPQSISVGAHFDEQAAVGEVLIIVSVIEQDRSGKALIVGLQLLLEGAGKVKILHIIGHTEGTVVTARYYHYLRSLSAADLNKWLIGVALSCNGVPVYLQHHLYAGVLLQNGRDSLAAPRV